MEFYSHARTLEDQKTKVGSKRLQDHTFGVSHKALEQFFPGLAFPVSADEVEALLYDIGLLHDLGKYSSHFQQYLLGRDHDHELKQHARFGAFVINQKYLTNQELGYLGYYIVKNHHKSLHDPTDITLDKFLLKSQSEEQTRIFESQKSTMLPHLAQIKQELNLPALEDWLTYPERKTFLCWIQDWTSEGKPYRYFLINYLFSLLIEADKLDASDTPPLPRVKIPAETITRYIEGFVAADNLQNRLRNEVRTAVLSNLDDPSIEDTRLFLLTAPTGIGKTLTAFDFAIRLRDKLPHRPQIITGLPFINIIEQTLDVYQQALASTNATVMAHYQYADVLEADKKIEPDEEIMNGYDQRRMQLDTWQGDVIVTSFVQLLQTMLSNKNKVLLKFNHLAGAIVIMDEVQSLKLEHVPLIGSVLYCMSKFLNTRFILMTATKPLVFELAEQEILQKTLQNQITKEVRWLLADPEPIFRQFQRTQIVPLTTEKLEDTAALLPIFASKWQSTQSALVVVNTVNRSIELFEQLQEWMIEKGYSNPCFYLSTNVIPAHRLAIIKQIKAEIKAGRAPILVATQVVEAGVDLDFDLGFRDLGPVDSIVQVAGRINRENTPERALSPLYIINYGDCKRIYGTITEAQALKALGNEVIPEPAYYGLVEKYFWEVSEKSAYDESKKYFDSIKYLRYDGEKNKDELPINTFRVIANNSNVVSVFVEWDDAASQAKAAFLKLLSINDKKVRYQAKSDFDQRFKKTFHQHIIAVPEQYAEGLPLISPRHQGVDIRLIDTENLPVWYVPPIGFQRKKAAQLAKEDNLAVQL